MWTEGKNISFRDILGYSLTSTTQDENRRKTIKRPESKKFFVTHNQQTPPMLCHYSNSEEYITNIFTETTLGSYNFSIYLQTNDIYFKVQLENNIYIPVSHAECSTKAQPLEQIQNQRIKQFQQNNFHVEHVPYDNIQTLP